MNNRVSKRVLTSYCPNNAEWFAEMFRLSITNSQLLQQLRPRTYKLKVQWLKVLGDDVPERIVQALHNKGTN